MCSSKLGLLAVVALLLGHRAAAFGPPASHDDDVKRTSNSKWGKAYWAGRGDADAITVEIYQKEDDCKTGRITDTSAVRALFRSWWLLNPHASQSNAVQYEDEHTKEFHMQVRVSSAIEIFARIQLAQFLRRGIQGISRLCSGCAKAR